MAGLVAVCAQPFCIVLQDFTDANAYDSYLRCSCVPPFNRCFVFIGASRRFVVSLLRGESIQSSLCSKCSCTCVSAHMRARTCTRNGIDSISITASSPGLVVRGARLQFSSWQLTITLLGKDEGERAQL